ncbi:unnamed protein product [Cuscuta europaea]|uniref:Ribosomal RNA small subunit methyltransferase NEP1 n=1 Tax=Cuscuta europaea TaxID=41803 RepID=A0A9P0ZJR1_CUSEU|nr:unnamed protein product [Cuscuta europaea]
MGRAYKVKGQKRKTKAENYDRDEIADRCSSEETTEAIKKAKTEVAAEDEEEAEKVVNLLPGIPIVSTEQSKKPSVIFILERASLEIAKIGKTYQLLNSDEHAGFLKRNNLNPAEYRPDIAHQAMLMILDSRLNKAGRLKALYVKTEKGVLFEVKPHVRIPRTFKRFSGIMLQLLQKLNITAVGKREKLLRVIKNPVTQYLPIDSRKIGFSHSSEKLVDIQNYVDNVGSDTNLVFVLGAMSHGKIGNDYVEDYVSVSDYPLSAAYCISMIANAVERKWKIL